MPEMDRNGTSCNMSTGEFPLSTPQTSVVGTSWDAAQIVFLPTTSQDGVWQRGLAAEMTVIEGAVPCEEQICYNSLHFSCLGC